MAQAKVIGFILYIHDTSDVVADSVSSINTLLVQDKINQLKLSSVFNDFIKELPST